MKTTSELPIGIRLNNPGNIEWSSDPWQGLVSRGKSMYAGSGTKQQRRFAQFVTPAFGIRALARTLITYQDKYGIRTVHAAINRWAPSVENNTGAYIKAVQRAVGGDMIDMHDYASLRPMVETIIRHENGPGPLKNANGWYDDATIDEALKMAGVKRRVTEAVKMPVTKETIGATTAATVGIAQIADVLPAVSDALDRSEAHLSSGSIVRIVFGVITIAAAVVIAWGQLKKHQAGVL